MSRVRRMSEEEAERRPTPAELADLEELDRKRNPTCRQCGRQIYPAMPCELSRCPWQRDGGKIVQARTVGG